MKHKPIIQANLENLTTKNEKLKYLAYAYKEWLIGLGIALILLLIFAFSMLTRQSTGLTVRVITDEPISATTLAEMTTAFKAVAGAETLIDIQNYLSSNTDQANLLAAQTVAQELDILVTVQKPSPEIQRFIDELAEEQHAFDLKIPGAYAYATVHHAPHPEIINALKKAHPSN